MNPQISQINTESKDSRTHAIIGADMEVHRTLGHGFLESVYQEALALEFEMQRIQYKREVPLPLMYKGRRLATACRADFVCFECIIVELKALCMRTHVEHAQVIHYLKATGFEVGLLINFGAPSLEWKRLVLSQINPR